MVEFCFLKSTPLSQSVFLFDGEIYNRVDIVNRHSLGTEDVVLSLLKLYPEAPNGIPELLDGEFAFVYADAETGQVVAARDPLGVRQLYYATDDTGDVVAFANNPTAMANAHTFPPGTVWAGGRFIEYTAINPYCTVRKTLECAVKKRVGGAQAVAIVCNGSVESSILVSLAAQAMDASAIDVFTLHFEGGSSEDIMYARMLCNHHSIRHTVVKFTMQHVRDVLSDVVTTLGSCDPATVRGAIPLYILGQHIAANTDIRVLLSSEGAEELFMGHKLFQTLSEAEANGESARQLANLHRFDLLKVGRSFAASGIQARLPYLDRDLANTVLHMEPSYKVEKSLLCSSFAHLHELCNLGITRRSKARFSDDCGFSYVPNLLQLLGGSDAEKRCYEDVLRTRGN